MRKKSGAFAVERGTRESSMIARDLSIRKWKFPSTLICIYKIPTALDALSAFISCDFKTFRQNLVKANSSRSLTIPSIAPLHRLPWCTLEDKFELLILSCFSYGKFTIRKSLSYILDVCVDVEDKDPMYIECLLEVSYFLQITFFHKFCKSIYF